MVAKCYWLFKSEPNVFSLDDLRNSPEQTTFWDGVRNYQARNLLRDAIHIGDGVLFYHSRVAPMAAVGTAKVVRGGAPDPSQFAAKHKYFDAAARPDNPRWFGVWIKFETTFQNPVTLPDMRGMESLEGMVLLRRGSRLSIQPVTAAQWKAIIQAGA